MLLIFFLNSQYTYMYCILPLKLICELLHKTSNNLNIKRCMQFVARRLKTNIKPNLNFCLNRANCIIMKNVFYNNDALFSVDIAFDSSMHLQRLSNWANGVCGFYWWNHFIIPFELIRMNTTFMMWSVVGHNLFPSTNDR